jgi:transcriptional antiterminator NusG
MRSEPHVLPWYAVRVRSRSETSVAAYLRNQGLEAFLPTYEDTRRWSDRVRRVELPLFPGYLFCRFDPLVRLPILKAPGVIHVVGVGRQPVPVDDAEIAAVQMVVRSGLPRQPWPYLHVGQRVRVESGALSGLEGVLLNLKGEHRVVVSVTLLQRSVSLEIDTSWAQPISPVVSVAGALEYPLLKPLVA